MLRITRAANGEVVFKLSGQMSAENLGELQTLLRAETSGRRILLDLKDLTLVDQDIVSFLKHSEANGIKLENCPAYIRQWIDAERGTNRQHKS
jgi:anti-anti-sigma regulatory factor